MRRQIDPALLPVASWKICRRGVAADSMTRLMSPATKSKTMRKINPVKIPMPTHPIMILGPTTEGFGISNTD